MNLDNMKFNVKPENRPGFEKSVMKWHRLAKIIGWKDLAKMYVDRVPPFQDVEKLPGTRKAQLKLARQYLINECVWELMDAGLEKAP